MDKKDHFSCISSSMCPEFRNYCEDVNGAVCGHVGKCGICEHYIVDLSTCKNCLHYKEIEEK